MTMSTLYEATAANAYFWQRLAVRASTRMAAYYLFEAFLGSKPNQELRAIRIRVWPSHCGRRQ